MNVPTDWLNISLVPEPIPRMNACPPAPSLLMWIDGVSSVSVSRLVRLYLVIVSPVTAWTEIGTFCNGSVRRCAETTISCTWLSDAGAPGCTLTGTFAVSASAGLARQEDASASVRKIEMPDALPVMKLMVIPLFYLKPNPRCVDIFIEP
jgi:hypothetical protein